MFTADLEATQAYQQEMQRRADQYRLARSAAPTRPLADRLTYFVGKLMVNLGRQLAAA